MKRFSQLLTVIFIIAGFAVMTRAQDQISTEKRKLIGELIAVTKIDSQMGQIVDTLLASSDTIYIANLKQTVEKRTDLTRVQKDRLLASSIQKAESFQKKFRERLPAAIDFAGYVVDAIYPLYDNAFSEKEIADLITFYKTETGQKVLSAMPRLMTDSMEVAQRTLLPKVTKLVDEILAEELAEPKQAPKPRN